MPEKLNINYDEHISTIKSAEQREFKEPDRKEPSKNIVGQPSKTKEPSPIVDIDLGITSTQPAKKAGKSLLDDDDDIIPQTRV